MKSKILFLIAILFSTGAFAQKNVTLTIKHMLGTSPFTLNQASTNNLNNNFTIARVDYYISNIIIIHDGGTQLPVSNKYILATGDANVVENLGSFNITNVEGIKFSIGVDSPNNNSDPVLWTPPHPLAPRSPVMHWGWASGYRFVALEGSSGPLLNNGYTIHGLFNRNYFSQTILTPGVVTGNDVVINLDADYNEALRDVNVALGPSDHGNDMTDLDVLKNFRDYVFSPGAGFPLSTSKVSKGIALNVYPNPSAGIMTVQIEDGIYFTKANINVFDILGKKIITVPMDKNGVANLNLANSGMYFLELTADGTKLANHKIIIQ